MSCVDHECRGTRYRMPAALNPPTTRLNVVENLALFLVANGRATNGRWQGPLRAADQRALFGVALGRGTIRIDGSVDRVAHSITVCFGTDWAVTDVLDLSEAMAWRHYSGSTPAPVDPAKVTAAGYHPVELECAP